jgi:hypothetical protein
MRITGFIYEKCTFLFSDVLGFEPVAQNVNHVGSEVEIVEGRSEVVARRHLRDFVLKQEFQN